MRELGSRASSHLGLAIPCIGTTVDHTMGVLAPLLLQIWQGHGPVYCLAVVYSPLASVCWRCHEVVASALATSFEHNHAKLVVHFACVIRERHLRL